MSRAAVSAAGAQASAPAGGGTPSRSLRGRKEREGDVRARFELNPANARKAKPTSD